MLSWRHLIVSFLGCASADGTELANETSNLIALNNGTTEQFDPVNLDASEPTVILYRDWHFSGDRWVLRGTGSCSPWGCQLGRAFPNDQVSSLKVLGPPGTVVTLYVNYPGDSLKHQLTPGVYDMNAMGIPNDSLSLVTVEMPKVVLYYDANYQGRSWTLSGVGSCSPWSCQLGNPYPNDQISSLKITGPPGTLVTLYVNYPPDSHAHVLGPGSYSMWQMGIPNDSLSDVHVEFIGEESFASTLREKAPWALPIIMMATAAALVVRMSKRKIRARQQEPLLESETYVC